MFPMIENREQKTTYLPNVSTWQTGSIAGLDLHTDRA
jgi:hypothetical protein